MLLADFYLSSLFIRYVLVLRSRLIWIVYCQLSQSFYLSLPITPKLFTRIMEYFSLPYTNFTRLFYYHKALFHTFKQFLLHLDICIPLILICFSIIKFAFILLFTMIPSVFDEYFQCEFLHFCQIKYEPYFSYS